MVNLIPQELGKRLQGRARQSTVLKLENFLELRDFISENENKIIEQGWENFYEEAGNWMDFSGDSISKGLDIIRAHPDENLKRWIKGGLSFDHIEKANTLQKYCQFTSEQILDAAIDLGGKNGKRMTVKEMTAFALGENVPLPPTYDFVKTLSGWLTKIPLKFKEWDSTKVYRVTELINKLMKELQS